MTKKEKFVKHMRQNILQLKILEKNRFPGAKEARVQYERWLAEKRAK